MAKKKPQTPIQYAAHIYMAESCNGAITTMADRDIVNTRIYAFVDGVNWERRRVRAAKRSEERMREYSVPRRGVE